MTEYLEFSIDKFTFRTAIDRLYSAEGLWLKEENNLVRIGMSDYLQQRSGDVAFVEIMPVGKVISTGDEIIVMETIKVNISMPSPISGKIIQVNPLMQDTPEIINQDPYGEGWLVLVEASNFEVDAKHLLSAAAFFEKTRQESEREVNQDS